MKLRNRKTGEVVEFRYLQADHVAPLVLTTYENDKPEMYTYNSLAELNEEWEDWEDYEEPKEYWYIDYGGRIKAINDANDEEDVARKEIGNYFETKEEAEKAVEKLRAWKRLRDKGYRVMMNNHVDGMLYLRIWNDTTDAPTPINKAGEIYKDLDLLFGGEE